MIDEEDTNTWQLMFGNKGVGVKKIVPTGAPSVIRTNREPKSRNTSKNSKMLELWEQGHTINEIAEIVDADNYAIRRILKRKGIVDPLAKPMIYPVRISKITGEFVGEFPSINEACRTLMLNRASVQRVLNGEFKQSGGYTIEYISRPNVTKINSADKEKS